MKENLIEQLNIFLDENQRFAIRTISESAKEFNIKAYIVGGVVRDLLLGKNIYDLDVVVEGRAISFCRFMEQSEKCKIKRISEDFGTAKIIIGNNIELDVASTRVETYPKAGHLPVVNKLGCSLQEDISRRDFSVNALALSINVDDFGDLIDLTNGLDDLQKKQLRILHNQSFIDDPTRIIRALRFEHKLSFVIEEETKKLMYQYLDKFDNDDICYERIKQVLKLAFNLNLSELFDEIIDNNIFKLITNNPRRIKGIDIFNAIKTNAKHIDVANIWVIYLIILCNLNDIEKFNFNAKEKNIAEDFYKLLNTSINKETDFEIYNQFKNYSSESIVAYISFSKSQMAQRYLEKLKDIKLEIDGNVLLNMGCPKGKKVGEILTLLLKEKIEGKIVTKSDEITLANKILFGC